MEHTGIKIDDKHTAKDWGLRMISMVIPMPETKTNYIDIPGADGSLDLTQSLIGDVPYNMREGVQFTFDASGGYEDWHAMTSEIANHLHGRKRKVIIDSDPGFFYEGRLQLDSQKSSEIINQIVITGTMDAYKYEVADSLGDWMWDDFNFETSIVREYNDLQVEGDLTVVIPGLRKHVIPIITASAAMTVSYQSKAYNLVIGANKIYDLALTEGENILTFTGSGAISIEYRGGSL